MVWISHLWILGCLVLCFSFAESAGAAADRTDSQRMRAVPGDVTTRAEVDAFAGREPERCMESKPGFEVCEWWLMDRDPGWQPLAQAIETRARIALVCELPVDGGAREAFSCGAYPRASNRNRWEVKQRDRGRRRRATEINRDIKHNHQRAIVQLDSARTLASLSGLVGAIPDECTPKGDGQLSCLWRTARRTWGHGTLATSIQAPYRKKVRMRCTVPSDGSRRLENSCLVEIGA